MKSKDTMSAKEYQDAEYKNLKEWQHQRNFYNWCQDKKTRKNYPGIEIIHAIPNDGSGSVVRDARLKSMGLTPGMPDLCLPVSKMRHVVDGVDVLFAEEWYLTLYIEMKRMGGRARPEQLAKHRDLRRQGHAVVICQGSEAAKDAVKAYYAGTLEDTP
tara:strand:+ start:247 stop:720 length:474 start_codon:yes stop_codon:yes gene_type:complete